MAQRGRPAKVLSSSDLDALMIFIQNLPFLKKNQIAALNLLSRDNQNFNEAELKILKLADREKSLHQQKQTLFEQIKVKQQNQQKLLENEVEILELEVKKHERDYFFRLDRALESYMKIQKAILNDRIRLENERRRDVLKKSDKSTSEAKKRRSEQNKRKYELGAAVLALFKELNVDIESKTSDELQMMFKKSMLLSNEIKTTEFYKESFRLTQSHEQGNQLFIRALNGLSEITFSNEKFHLLLLKKYLL